MRRPRLMPGDIVEVSISAGKKGYVRVLRRDKFGLLLQLLGRKPVSTSRSMVLAYVNEHSIRKDWSVVQKEPIGSEGLNIPPFFFGSSVSGWTIDTEEGRTIIPAEKISFEELKRKGYVHKVLWLAKDIAEYFDGKPLVWPTSL